MFRKKSVLRNFAKSTWKHLCQSLFFNKFAGLRPTTLLKKEASKGVFLWILRNFKEHIFDRTPPENTITYWNYINYYYKTITIITIIQLLLLLLKLLFKNYYITIIYYMQWFARTMPRTSWIECGGLTFEKASDNAIRMDQLIK